MDPLLSFWGKTFPTAGDQATTGSRQILYKPVIHHLLDVAAVARTYLSLNSDRARREAKALGLDPEGYGRLAAFLAGLHDLGKFTRNFQIKRRELWPALLGPFPIVTPAGPSHWRATASLLRHEPIAERFRRFMPALTAGVEGDLIAAIAGHHGRPPEPSKDNAQALRSGLRDRRWIDDKCVQSAMRAMESLAAIIAPPTPPVMNAVRWSWGLSGLITLADWVGSDADHFGPRDVETPLFAYWREALEAASQALAAKGLVPPRREARLGLATISTRAAAAPRPMQALVSEIQITDEPQLHLIEDSTGSGKTEAALWLAARLMAEGRSEGVFIALPTMATANAMHERLKDVVARLFPDGDASLILAHGNATLARDFAALNSPALSDGDSETTTAEDCNAWISDDRRRAFFADLGAGTIDQAFLAVLPKKYLTLRQYALGARVLVVDEAHCFDAYMREELDTLIELHAMNGGSTIVLSATLSLNARRKMAASFYRGCGVKNAEASVAAKRCGMAQYPLLTSVDRSSVKERPARLAPELARTVDVIRLGSRADAAEAAMEAAEKGAAVLVIANAVDECIGVMQGLAVRRPADTLHLFHARFAQCDRINIENRVLARFGRESATADRSGHILVATQVVEQSLDLDFDLVISDLAPIDLLIQRAGRLWRHMDQRPTSSRALNGPKMMIISPDPNAVVNPEWLRGPLGRAASVYQDAGILWRSARTVFGFGRIRTPEDLRPMIEAVYGEGSEPVPEGLRFAEQRGLGNTTHAQTLGAFNVVSLEDGYEKLPSDLRQDESIGTRLGEPTVTLRLARRMAGKLTPWFADEAFPTRIAWSLSEVTLRKAFWGDAQLPAADEAIRQEARRDWTEWEASKVLVEVGGDGLLQLTGETFSYDALMGVRKL
jgi:CRISPR-associated endonuclease/helicase Cas3